MFHHSNRKRTLTVKTLLCELQFRMSCTASVEVLCSSTKWLDLITKVTWTQGWCSKRTAAEEERGMRSEAKFEEHHYICSTGPGKDLRGSVWQWWILLSKQHLQRYSYLMFLANPITSFGDGVQKTSWVILSWGSSSRSLHCLRLLCQKPSKSILLPLGSQCQSCGSLWPPSHCLLWGT